MTPTSTPSSGFETPTIKRIDREDIAELIEKLITAYLDSLLLLRARSAESEDASNISSRLNSMLFNNNIRELSEGEIKVLAGDVTASVTMKWFFTRMLSSIRAVSLDNNLIDDYVCSAMAFFPLSKMENEYSAENSISTESQFKAIYNKYPFMKVLALFEILNISQEIEFRKVTKENDD